MCDSFQIIWVDTLSSTNLYAKEHSKGEFCPFVISAREQTGGRGQGEHLWTSEKEMNLTFSVALPFRLGQLESRHASYISKLVPLSICSLLSRHYIHSIIKYPNDILVDGRKISGILIENRISGDNVQASVIGIGINVKQTSFPSFEIPATSMCLETDNAFKDCSLEALLIEYIETLEEILPSLYSEEGRESIDRLYLSQLRSCDIIKAGF